MDHVTELALARIVEALHDNGAIGTAMVEHVVRNIVDEAELCTRENDHVSSDELMKLARRIARDADIQEP